MSDLGWVPSSERKTSDSHRAIEPCGSEGFESNVCTEPEACSALPSASISQSVSPRRQGLEIILIMAVLDDRTVAIWGDWMYSSESLVDSRKMKLAWSVHPESTQPEFSFVYYQWITYKHVVAYSKPWVKIPGGVLRSTTGLFTRDVDRLPSPSTSAKLSLELL